MPARSAPMADPVAYIRSCGPTCSPRQAAKVLGGNPYYYNIAAKNGTLDLEHTWRGRNLIIYTESVVKRLTGGNGNAGTDDQSQ